MAVDDPAVRQTHRQVETLRLVGVIISAVHLQEGDVDAGGTFGQLGASVAHAVGRDVDADVVHATLLSQADERLRDSLGEEVEPWEATVAVAEVRWS